LLVFSVQFSGKRKKEEEEDENGWGLAFGGAAVFYAADEALEHGGDFAGFLDHFAGVCERFQIKGFLDAIADVELSAELSAGALADAEKADEIAIAVALGTFGDV
jgi:hypothetical protein